PLPPDTLEVTGAVQVDDAILTADYYQPRWVFVEPRFFVDVQLGTHVFAAERNVTFIRETRNITNITVQNNVFVNRSIELQQIQAVVGNPIQPVRVQQVTSATGVDVRAAQQTRVSSIPVFTPQVRGVTRQAAPPEQARAKEADRPRVSVKPELVRPE